jgi:hypothetical protein
VEAEEDGEERTGSTQVGEARHHTNLSVSALSQEPSERTASPLPGQRVEEALEPVGVPIVGGGGQEVALSVTSSHPDISTAAPSFITAPATIEGTTDSSGRTVSSWGGISHMVDRSDGTWRPA